MDLSSLCLPKKIQPSQKPVAMSTEEADEDSNGGSRDVNKYEREASLSTIQFSSYCSSQIISHSCSKHSEI